MAITSVEEWEERAAAFLKHKLQEAEITYAELAKRLKKHGFKETEASVTNKLKRGHSRRHGFWPYLRLWNWMASRWKKFRANYRVWFRPRSLATVRVRSPKKQGPRPSQARR